MILTIYQPYILTMSQPPNFRKKLLPAQSVLSLNGPHLVKYMVNEPVLFVRARDHQLVVSLYLGQLCGPKGTAEAVPLWSINSLTPGGPNRKSCEVAEKL